MHPAGKKKPNGYGLYDMSGNVWEWVEDWYDAKYYAMSPKSNPKCADAGEWRDLRGGSWVSRADYGRSAYRNWLEPAYWNYNYGFRCVEDFKTK